MKMTEELPKAYDPKEYEDKIYKLWEDSGYFNPDNLAKSRKSNAARYSIHLPPPNVTGSLHMGHALNAVLSDILIRYHRMNGDKTVWFPGTDHAGIATQNVVEKQLKKEGKTRWDLGREKFIELVWRWKEKYGNKIISQLKRIGASCDWSRQRFTMDPEYARWVKKAFIHYYKKGLIYRGTRVVSWCPRCYTSLSDLEIEYKEVKSKLYYIRYPLAQSKSNALAKESKKSQTKDARNDYIVVATTRPETMLGDTAVAVNPKDKRYKDVVGKKVILPIQNRIIPVIADSAVEMGFGTGAVKVTPAHDLLDAEIAERHNLEFMQVIDERGRMNTAAGKICEGLKAKDCRDKVLDELKKLGVLEKEEDYTHNVSICYRCGAELQPILSRQWFLRMTSSPQNQNSKIKKQKSGMSLRDMALKAVKSGKVKIKPKNFEKILINWLENIKDWTISRQIWWGHRIPAFFCRQTQEEIKNQKSDWSNERILVAEERPKRCPYCKKCEMEQSPDVLDTWFSSALWPFAGLSPRDLKNFYPSNVLITARDIINLWVARMIFSGLEFMGSVPFPEVLIHATILTKEGKRMSKSKGTGIDPVELVEKYGADATRFGIVWQAMGNQDIRWDETAVVAGKKFANKLWNIARFVQQKNESKKLTIKTKNSQLNLKNNEDKIIMSKFVATKKAVEKDLKNYRFGRALRIIYNFVWHEFADKYIESVKKREDEEGKEVLGHTLMGILRLLHPFMPFVTEILYQKIYAQNGRMLMMEKW